MFEGTYNGCYYNGEKRNGIFHIRVIQMLDKNKFDQKQTYSIRKLTIGTASVLIGLTFLGFSGSQVHAAETTANQPEKSEQVLTVESKQQSTQNSSSVEKVERNGDQYQNKIKTEISAAYQKLDSEDKTDQAIILGENNTTSGLKTNGQGKNANITNVPADGSIKYDYSITAKNKNTNQTQVVSSTEAGKNNNAILIEQNAQDPEAHLTLENVSKTDQMIGNSKNDSNPNPNDEAVLMINAWYSNKEKLSLQISSTKAANVVFIKNGKVINDNALSVYYLAQNGTWYSYEEMMKNFGAAAISNVRQIGFRGVIPGETTAQMNVPLIIDPTGNQFNEIDLKAQNDQSIYVRTYKQPKKLWTVDEAQNTPISLVTRNQDGSYDAVNIPQLIESLPKVGEVIQITNSGNILDTSGKAFYEGGSYKIQLSKIQQVIDKYGYSVNPQARDLTTLMPFYSYDTNTSHKVIIHGLNKEDQNKRIFYVEVH